MWWYKPLDIQVPTAIYGDGAREILAWMWMETRYLLDNRLMWTEGSHVKLKDENSKNDGQVRTGELFSSRKALKARDPAPHAKDAAGSITLRDGDELLSTGLCFFRDDQKWGFTPPTLNLSPVDVERWRLASELYKRKVQTYHTEGSWKYNKLIKGRCKNWPPLINTIISGSNIDGENQKVAWVIFI